MTNPFSSQLQTSTSLQLYAQGTNCGPATLLVQDDPQGSTSSYSVITNADGSFASGVFTWSTQPGTTDGTVIGPISWYEQLTPFTVQLTMSPYTVWNSWYVANSMATYQTSTNPTLIIKRVSCSCGNGILEPYEQCDPPDGVCCMMMQWLCFLLHGVILASRQNHTNGVENITIASNIRLLILLCMADCLINPQLAYQPTACRPAVSNCDIAEYCNATTGQCPPDTVIPSGTLCNANPHKCGYSSYCTGSYGYCPAIPTAVQGAGTVCQMALSPCYTNSCCDGVSMDCPPLNATIGASCTNQFEIVVHVKLKQGFSFTWTTISN